MATFNASEGIVDVLAVPLGDLIAEVGRGVAEAQRAIDQQVMEHFRAIYDESIPAFEALRSIGYQPTWYQIPEVTAEIAIALTLSASRDSDTLFKGNRITIHGAPIDAGYQSKFNYGVQASSSLKFRIVPVPPPSAATRMNIVPNLAGLALAKVRVLLDNMGIEFEISPPDATDDAIVTSHLPAPGGVLPSSAVLLIKTKPESP